MLPNTHAASTPSLSSSVYRNSAWWRVAVNRMVSWSAGTTSRTRCSSAATLSSALGAWRVVNGVRDEGETGALMVLVLQGVAVSYPSGGCEREHGPQVHPRQGRRRESCF